MRAETVVKLVTSGKNLASRSVVKIIKCHQVSMRGMHEIHNRSSLCAIQRAVKSLVVPKTLLTHDFSARDRPWGHSNDLNPCDVPKDSGS